METVTETGVGPYGKSIDIWPVCELVIYPPSTSPTVVASVYGAAAVVPLATAVAAAKPTTVPAPAKVSVTAFVAVKSPNASAFPSIVTNSMSLLSDTINPPPIATVLSHVSNVAGLTLSQTPTTDMPVTSEN